jgi:hypothetical protein
MRAKADFRQRVWFISVRLGQRVHFASLAEANPVHCHRNFMNRFCLSKRQTISQFPLRASNSWPEKKDIKNAND